MVSWTWKKEKKVSSNVWWVGNVWARKTSVETWTESLSIHVGSYVNSRWGGQWKTSVLLSVIRFDSKVWKLFHFYKSELKGVGYVGFGRGEVVKDEHCSKEKEAAWGILVLQNWNKHFSRSQCCFSDFKNEKRDQWVTCWRSSCRWWWGPWYP